MRILQTIDLKKYYGTEPNITRALDGVNFSVNDGEFVAVVGTSGSGKSTLLHMMGGLDTPTSGNVIVRDKELSKMNDEQLTIFRRRNIGFIFQNYNLVPILNVYENIVLPVELDGDTVDQKFLDEIVHLLGLEDKLKNMPNNLSGGQQQLVWGLAIALVTAMLYKYKDKSDSFLFIIGTLLGGAYEYLCSVFTEIVFGKVFWDYSEIPFNLGGRINLLYCFFWGIAAVVWFKKIYPYISAWIEKIPMLTGKMLTWFLIIFMVCNVAVSCIALVRYDERGKGVVAENSIQKWADEHYDDAKMEKIYPNAKATE